MSDNTLEILIRTKADLTAAKALQATLEHQIYLLKLQGKTSEDLDQRLASTKKHIEEYTAKNGDAAESSEKFEITQRELHRTLGSINPTLGQSANIIANLRNVYLAGALTLGLLIEKVAELGAANQELVNQPGIDWEKNTAQIEAMRKALDDGATSLHSLEHEIELLANKPILPERRANEAIELLKKQFDTQGQLLTDRQKRDEELINQAENEGVITHDQALIQKLKLDEDYMKRRLALEAQARQAEINQRLQEAREDRDERGRVSGQIGLPAHAGGTGAQAAADRANEAVAKNQAIIDKDKTDLANAQAEHAKTLQDIQDVADKMGTLPDKILQQYNIFGRGSMSATDTQKLLEERSGTQLTGITNLQRQIKQRQDASAGLKDAADAANAALNEFKDTLRSLTARIRELEIAIPESQRTAAAQGAADHAKGVSKSAGDLAGLPISSQFNVGDIGVAQGLAEAKAHGQKLNEVQQQWLDHWNQFAAQNAPFVQQIINLQARVNGTLTTAAEKLAAHDLELKVIQQRIQNLHLK